MESIGDSVAFPQTLLSELIEGKWFSSLIVFAKTVLGFLPCLLLANLNSSGGYLPSNINPKNLDRR